MESLLLEMQQIHQLVKQQKLLLQLTQDRLHALLGKLTDRPCKIDRAVFDPKYDLHLHVLEYVYGEDDQFDLEEQDWPQLWDQIPIDRLNYLLYMFQGKEKQDPSPPTQLFPAYSPSDSAYSPSGGGSAYPPDCYHESQTTTNLLSNTQQLEDEDKAEFNLLEINF